MSDDSVYPAIGDYALLSDGHSAALVSREGSVDWCCIRRLDAGSCFGRLLDREKGGFCEVSPAGEDWTASRRYLDNTLVLETTFHSEAGEARLIDCLVLPPEGEVEPRRQLLRVVEGVRGYVELDLGISPRFDYGALRPWLRQEGVRLYSAIGGDDALVISSDAEIFPTGNHDLKATVRVHAGDRVRLSIESRPPEDLTFDPPRSPGPEELDRRLDETIRWWRDWASQIAFDGPLAPGALLSALAIKGLTNRKTGAIAAAATTSLPEQPGGGLNWDYRFSWIRDSFFSVRSLAEIGFTGEADAFRRFVERSAAGNAEEMQVMYGVGGERRLTEETLDLEGYRGARPVRAGNAAADQLQLDAYGELLELTWRWYQRGNSPDDDYWRFLLDLVNTAADRWREPDSGLWEIRGEPRHFVHSKAMCWAALDRGIRLAEGSLRLAPIEKWKKARDEVREAIEKEGYDEKRGIFVQAFGTGELDAALLLLPNVDFVAYDDERMVRTTDAIREELDDDGLLKRYRREGGDEEGAFLACSFWLAECLVHQGRIEDAQEVFDRALATGNDLGLFSEEYDTGSGEMLGNFPQALTHLSHITAAVALAGAR